MEFPIFVPIVLFYLVNLVALAPVPSQSSDLTSDGNPVKVFASASLSASSDASLSSSVRDSAAAQTLAVQSTVSASAVVDVVGGGAISGSADANSGSVAHQNLLNHSKGHTEKVLLGKEAHSSSSSTSDFSNSGSSSSSEFTVTKSESNGQNNNAAVLDQTNLNKQQSVNSIAKQVNSAVQGTVTAVNKNEHGTVIQGVKDTNIVATTGNANNVQISGNNKKSEDASTSSTVTNLKQTEDSLTRKLKNSETLLGADNTQSTVTGQLSRSENSELKVSEALTRYAANPFLCDKLDSLSLVKNSESKHLEDSVTQHGDATVKDAGIVISEGQNQNEGLSEIIGNIGSKGKIVHYAQSGPVIHLVTSDNANNVDASGNNQGSGSSNSVGLVSNQGQIGNQLSQGLVNSGSSSNNKEKQQFLNTEGVSANSNSLRTIDQINAGAAGSTVLGNTAPASLVQTFSSSSSSNSSHSESHSSSNSSSTSSSSSINIGTLH